MIPGNEPQKPMPFRQHSFTTPRLFHAVLHR